jgi:hypothetical protein
MAQLKIAAQNMGPLSVEVIAAEQDFQVDRPLFLSSTREQETVTGLSPGSYAVVATRPNGETLVRSVKVDQDAFVDFAVQEGRSPHEFLTEAAQRGLVPTVSSQVPHDDHSSLKDLVDEKGGAFVGVTGASARNLKTILSKRTDFNTLGLERRGTLRHYRLLRWGFDGNSWRKLPFEGHPATHLEVRRDYLQVNLRPHYPFVTAFGLLDASGYGPIVIAPFFRDGFSLTLLAEGIYADQGADRVSNPSGVRVPVAIALPNRRDLADLLSALAAPAFAAAEGLWDQQREGIGSDTAALDVLLRKFDDPIGAILAAHFLGRFSPARAPLGWLRNLHGLLPRIADTSVLLALRLIEDGSPKNRPEIKRLLKLAQSSPVCLFARARALLTQSLRRYDSAAADADYSRSGDYLDVAAEAGGLEAFWGSSPEDPGRTGRTALIDFGPEVMMDGAHFVP